MGKHMILAIAPVLCAVLLTVCYVLVMINQTPGLYAFEMKSLRQGATAVVRVGYFSMCGGSNPNNVECHQTWTTPDPLAPFDDKSPDFQRLILHGQEVRKRVLTYFVLVSSIFFALEMIFIMCQWFADAELRHRRRQGRPNKGLSWLTLICAYLSLFFVLPAAGQAQFSLAATSLYNGVIDVLITPSPAWQALHWVLAVTTFILHIILVAFHKVEKPLDEQATKMMNGGGGRQQQYY